MSSFVDRLVEAAEEEWDFFGRQAYDVHGNLIRRGKRETDGAPDDPHAPFRRVGMYWKEIGRKDLDGKSTGWPWSAAFISYLMKKAGAKDRFRYSAAHSIYIRAAIDALAASDTNAAFFGRRINDYAPSRGDLVCCGRGKNKDVTYDTAEGAFHSHADLVVATRPGEIDVIGGNVSNSVTMKTYRTNENGHLIPAKRTPWFVVMENRFDKVFA